MVFNSEMDLGQPKARVNGSQLASHQGRGVCLLGNAHSQSPNGDSFKVAASDGQDVTIKMQQPVQEYLQGLVEVHGQVDHQNSVVCSYYVKFPPETSQNFDLGTYNKALELIHQHPEHYIQGVQQA